MLRRGLTLHCAPDLCYTLRREVPALPGRRIWYSLGHRSHSQERQSEDGMQASLPRAQPPSPQPSLPPLVWPRRGKGQPSGHTCWWLPRVRDQEKKRHGAGSRSAASHARCLGHRLEGRRDTGSVWLPVPTGHRGSWSKPSHRGQRSSPGGCPAPWQLVEKRGLTGTGRRRRAQGSMDPGHGCLCVFFLLPSTLGASSPPCQPLPVTLDFSASEVSL